MYNTVAALCVRNTQFSGDLGEFCPLFMDKNKAVKHAKKVSNNFYHSKCTLCTTDSKGNTIIRGEYWIMAIIPIIIRDIQYFEVVKAVKVRDNPYIDVCLSILSIFDDYKGNGLTTNDIKCLAHFAVNTNGHIYKDGKIYELKRDIKGQDTMYYQMKVDFGLTSVKPIVSYIVWATYNNASYYNMLLLTSPIAQFCYNSPSATNKHQLEILALRNMGWQWCIDHIDMDSMNNSFANLQLCTLQAGNKLIDIRRHISTLTKE